MDSKYEIYVTFSRVFLRLKKFIIDSYVLWYFSQNIKNSRDIFAKLSQAKPQLQLSWLALASLNFT